MSRVAALLRAVNVGGRRIAMADLRAALADAGFRAVETYLQSGNVLVDEQPNLAGRMEEVIGATFGIPTTVITRTHDQLAELRAALPFPEAEPRFRHVVFCDREPQAPLPPVPEPDVAVVIGSHVVVHYVAGSGRSKATLSWFERALGVTATARNWNTLEALADRTA